MKKHALIKIIALCMAAAMLLTSCGGGSTPATQAPAAATQAPAAATQAPADNTPAEEVAPPAEDKGLVTIRTTFGPGEMSDAQIKEFNDDHTGSIKVEYVAADDTKLMAMIAAGNAPDIIRVYAVQILPTYVTRGLCLDLQDRLDKSAVFSEDDMLDICGAYRWDGQDTGKGPCYGFVKDWSLDQQIVVNNVLLEEKGVPTPSLDQPLTYSDVMDICNKVFTKNGDNIDVYGFAGWDILFTIGNALAMARQFDKLPWSSDYKTVSFNTPEIKNIFNKINEAVQGGTWASPVNPLPGDSLAMLVEGKVGLLQMGYWCGGVFRTNDQARDIMDQILLLPAYQMDGYTKRCSPCLAACGAIMLRQSLNPDEAFTVMEWFFGQQPAIDRAKSGWGIPAFKSQFDLMPVETTFDKQWHKSVLDEMTNSDYIYVQYNPFINSNAIGALFTKIVEPVYFGTSTVDEALPELEAQIQKLVEEGLDIAGIQ